MAASMIDSTLFGRQQANPQKATWPPSATNASIAANAASASASAPGVPSGSRPACTRCSGTGRCRICGAPPAPARPPSRANSPPHGPGELTRSSLGKSPLTHDADCEQSSGALAVGVPCPDDPLHARRAATVVADTACGAQQSRFIGVEGGFDVLWACAQHTAASGSTPAIIPDLTS